MGTVLVGIALALLSSVAYAAAAVLQERLATLPVRRLAGNLHWWLATALNGVAAVLHLAALRAGPLSLIQALGILTLPMAVPLAAMTARRRVSGSEWNGMAFTLAGLLGLVFLIGSAGNDAALTLTQLITVLVTAAAALVALEGISRILRGSVLWTAAAAGIAFGISSAVSQTITVRLADDGVSAVFTPLVLIAGLGVAVLTVLGLLLTQHSYRNGLGAPLAVSTIANPVAAAVIGIVLLGDRVTGGYPGSALALACAVGAAIGVTMLANASRGGRTRPPVADDSLATAPAEA
ncbi:DMT family transporter [Cryptosporangium sp. NPDC051539]|uniref:DMT family transporter n=1 Tax=Cryptosporangium sp. NPDC051539 TaxID=3363962 RepID=UPI0037B620EC